MKEKIITTTATTAITIMTADDMLSKWMYKK